MYIEEKQKVFLQEYFIENEFTTNKEFSNLLESDLVMGTFKATISKLFDKVSSILDDIRKSGDTINQSKGDIRKWSEFKKLDEVLLQMKSHNKNNLIIDKLLEIETCLLKQENIDLFRQGYIEQNKQIQITYESYVQILVLGINHLLANNTSISVSNTIGFNINISSDIKDKDILKNIEKVYSDLKSGKTRDLLKSLLKNSSVLNEAVDPFFGFGTAAIIIFLMSLLMARQILRYYYRYRKQLSTYFEMQAKFLDISASRNNSSSSRDKQIKIADEFRSLAEKVRVKESSDNTIVKMEIQDENREYKDLIANSSNEFSSFSLG
jgi:hypothetical protein